MKTVTPFLLFQHFSASALWQEVYLQCYGGKREFCPGVWVMSREGGSVLTS